MTAHASETKPGDLRRAWAEANDRIKAEAQAAARQRARNRAADEGLEAMPSFKRGDGK